MTDKARELLERCAFQLGNENMTYWNAGLVEEIRAYLSDTNPSETINSQEVDRSEPVAYLYDLDAYCDHRPEQDVLARKIPKGIPSEYLKNVRPLFLHPAPRKPFVRLSEEEVSEILSSAHTPYEAVCAPENRLFEKNR